MEESEQQLFGDRRLRGSGIGSIVAGVILGTLSLFLAFEVAAAAVLLVGLLGWYTERKRGDVTGISIGIAAVGGIGLLEALFTIADIDVLLLAAFAIGAGLLDVVLGNFFGQLRERHR